MTPDRRHLLAAATAVVVSYATVHEPTTARLDRRAGALLSRPLGPVADVVVSSATDLGSVFAIGGIATALAMSGRRRAALDVVAVGAIAWTAAQAIKPLVNRQRPYQADGLARLVSEPAGASWPSGHVAVAAAMSAALAPAMTPRGRFGAAALAGFVGFSRIYVGVHYLSDVVAGLGIGVASTSLWRGLRHLVRTRVRNA